MCDRLLATIEITTSRVQLEQQALREGLGDVVVGALLRREKVAREELEPDGSEQPLTRDLDGRILAKMEYLYS